MNRSCFLKSILLCVLLTSFGNANSQTPWYSLPTVYGIPSTHTNGKLTVGIMSTNTLLNNPFYTDAWLNISSAGGPPGFSNSPDLKFSGSQGNFGTIRASGQNDYDVAQIRFRPDGSGYPWRSNIEFWTKPLGTSGLPTTTWEQAMIIAASGGVGIGVTTPTYGYKLHVGGNLKVTGISALKQTSVTGSLTVSNNTTSKNLIVTNNAYLSNLSATGISSLNILNVSGLTNLNEVSIAGDANITSELSVQGNSQFGADVSVTGNSVFSGQASFTNNVTLAEKMTIGSTVFPSINNSQGNSLRLFVEGGILAQEVIIKLTEGAWPDFVFSEEYKRLTIGEVDTFISKNGHLPEFPNAEDVENNGLKLAETVVLQQKTIEEMYLHIIELNEKLTKLENELSK